MKAEYRVTIHAVVPPTGLVGSHVMFASNTHYAVREVLHKAGRLGQLPRGWKRLDISVTRP